MPASEIWNLLPPRQNGDNVLAQLVAFKKAVEGAQRCTARCCECLIHARAALELRPHASI